MTDKYVCTVNTLQITSKNQSSNLDLYWCRDETWGEGVQSGFPPPPQKKEKKILLDLDVRRGEQV